MSSAAFVTVVGVAAVGDPVDVTPRTAEHLKANGWTPPEEHYREIIAVHEGYGVEAWCPACREHWPCKASMTIESPTKENTP